MTREEFYKLTDILNSEVLGSFMHGGEADELIAMFEEVVEHSNILKQEEPVSDKLEKAAVKAFKQIVDSDKNNFLEIFKAGAAWKNEQMMAKAIEGGCFSYKNGFVHISCDIDEHLTDIKIGDKVKVIVIKED